MHHRLLFVFLSLFFASVLSAQSVTYNHLVNPEDTRTKEVMVLLENYLSSHPEEQRESPYWNSAEQAEYKRYDLLEGEFQPSLYMGFPVHVLSITFQDDVGFIKAQFSYTQEDGTPYVLAIVNYVAEREDGVYKLKNWLTHHQSTWNTTQVGVVTYHYPKYHTFDQAKAQQLLDFIHITCAKAGVEPSPFDYYLADHFDELQALKGIDYYMGMGGEDVPSGRASEKRVFCGGLGEYYPHEVFHVQIDPHFPNKHWWVSEGMATLLGGSRGQTLDWHLARTHAYLQDHPEVDLSNLFALSNLDELTAYHYVIGGLIAQCILQQGGWPLLLEFMDSGPKEEDYYNAIEDLLGVEREALNAFLRQAIAEYATYSGE